jgi:DNA-binding PadR family transcriptional regulator
MVSGSGVSYPGTGLADILDSSILEIMTNETGTDEKAARLLPLKPLEFAILIALAEEDLHGYGIARRIAERDAGGVTLAPGNLYGVLDRLIEQGLIEGKRKRGERRRRDYAMTAFGRQVASAEASRLQEVLRTAKRLELLAGGRST